MFSCRWRSPLPVRSSPSRSVCIHDASAGSGSGNSPHQPGAIELTIRRFIARDQRQSWCPVVASNEPHDPYTKGDPSCYEPDRLQVPPYLVDTPETRRSLANYYAEITYLDGQVGRCLRILQETGTDQNTLFLSEQGSGFRHCKWTLYDTGIRAAAIARWPGKIDALATSDALIQYTDILPTLIEAAGRSSGISIARRSNSTTSTPILSR